ncbi:hypothetical protein FRC04_002192 [Tulasnella sp. 424]|nr:hypothetical protein FRC04_002192 [Tulasnella sp. 424]
MELWLYARQQLLEDECKDRNFNDFQEKPDGEGFPSITPQQQFITRFNNQSELSESSLHPDQLVQFLEVPPRVQVLELYPASNIPDNPTNLPSERVGTHDKALQRLLDAPEELLTGMDGNGMENKVVAVLNRAALLHVRLVLHRAVVVSSALGGDATRAKSLEVAIRSAETLVHLYIAHSTAATLPTIKLSPSATGPTSSALPPAYLANLTQHTYDATLFLVSLLINFPLPSVAQSFQSIRQDVRSAFHAFGVVKIAGADRAWKLLGALRPLWEKGSVALARVGSSRVSHVA